MNEKILIQIKNYFKTKPVQRAYLFGSVARNESSTESDVDILVELDYTKPIGLGFVRMQLELETLLNKKVDLLSAGGISKHIKPFIDQDKVIIYEK